MIAPVPPAPRTWRVLAGGGAMLFAAALGYFLYAYTFTFAETRQAGATTTAMLWNIGLFSVFAMHHSLFARERVKALVARTVPPPLERSFYVWTASLLFIAVCATWRPVAGVAWHVHPVAGYLVMAAGVWLTVRSATAIDVWELAGVRQVWAPGTDRIEPRPGTGADGEFTTTGPYGVVRHPIYLGWFLMVFGVPVMTGTRLAFAVISCVYLLVAIPFEERTLHRTTDGRYAEYTRLVPWRLVPWLY